ncbi:MAG: AzlC family ABC transporter permease [Pseudonocardiaceae bacterium]
MTIEAERLESWIGAAVCDAAGDRLGKLSEVFYRGDEPVAVQIRSGLAGRHQSLAVLREARVTRDSLRLGVASGAVLDGSGPLDGGQLAALAEHDDRLRGVAPADIEGYQAREERMKAAAKARASREEPAERPPSEAFRAGLRAGLPYGLANAVLALSFGVLAREAGFSAVGAIVMSAVVFAGSAQFAALSVIAQGGGLPAAVGAATLMHSRFVPMGIALAPSLPGGPLRRAAEGQTVVDASWAMANRGDGRFDRPFLFGASAIQYVFWVSGTAFGALAGDTLGNPDALGLDAIFPAFFLALLLGELRDRRSRGVAAAGGLVALALVPLAPPGISVLAASMTALIGLRRRAA